MCCLNIICSLYICKNKIKVIINDIKGVIVPINENSNSGIGLLLMW